MTLPKPQKGSGLLERYLRRQARRTAAMRALADEKRHAAAQWDKLRTQVGKRDGWKCRACERRVWRDHVTPFAVMHTHHVIFQSQGGQDDLGNLCSLCANCHRLVHDRRLMVTGDPNGVLWFEADGRIWQTEADE